MSLPAHLEIVGNKQGVISRSSDMKGREGTILVHHVQHSMTLPSEVTAAGKSLHTPMIITKSLDQVTPKLNQAFISSELLTVTLKWYRIDPTGHEEHYFSHILSDAIIKSIDLDMEMEHLSIAYSKILWRWELGAVEAQDYWQGHGQ